jgi:hypothetical protein
MIKFKAVLYMALQMAHRDVKYRVIHSEEATNNDWSL